MAIKIIEDKEQRDIIRKAIADNDGYCPCKIFKNEDTKCMCKQFRDQVALGTLGPCDCGLYENEESKVMKIYLAGSIFYYGDILRNQDWAKKVRDAFPGVDLYSPVENTDINGAEGKKKFAGSKEIADGDNARLDQTDVLIACIDGDVIPAGTSAEIGVMREKIRRGDKKFIVGICTDNRQMYLTHSEAKDAGGASALGEQQYSYQNLYVTGLIKQSGVLVSNIDDAIAAIRKWLEDSR